MPRKLFFTPGPTQLYPTVPAYIQDALERGICSISHRSRAFQEIAAHTTSSIKKLLNIPDNFYTFFLGSATEAMERIIQNCVARKSFHPANGAFSERFCTIALAHQKSPERYTAAFGEGFDFDAIEVPVETEPICITQNEQVPAHRCRWGTYTD